MAKKNINAANAFDKVWSDSTQETQTTQITQETQITSPKNQETVKKAGRPVERQETYRFSLYLDGDLSKYIKYAVWRDRKKSVTQYLNDLVRADMAEYIRNGGDESEWMKE